jgi:hypothetical protein
MVVNHLLDDDLGDAGSVNASVGKLGQRAVIRLEDEPVRAPEVDRELAGTVGSELMAAAGHPLHVAQRRGGGERREPQLEPPPVRRTPSACALAVARAGFPQLPVEPRDLDGEAPLS